MKQFTVRISLTGVAPDKSKSSFDARVTANHAFDVLKRFEEVCTAMKPKADEPPNGD